MEQKVLLISKSRENLYGAIIYWLEQERIEYIVEDHFIEEIPSDITNIIYINYNIDLDEKNIQSLDIPAIVISNSKILIENNKSFINYIVTPLTNDDSHYTPVQKEYLYRRGIYSIITNKIYELLNNEDYINGIIIDVSNCKTTLKDWVFNFESIGETYAWLSKKNLDNPDFTNKIINFYHEKIYNDSAKEINYLADKIKNIQSNKKTIDIFICTNSELEIFKNNYFFKLLLKNICDNFHIYIIDRDVLIEKEPDIYTKLLDGVLIYEDCVYIDTYDDEYSLGRVDCKQSTIDEYNKYFDYIIENYGHRLYTEEDINGI